jgi:kynurenine formamidase
MLAGVRVVDLSQPLGPSTAPWPGSPRFVATGTRGADGIYARSLRLEEHLGTHFDAPSHFVVDGANVDDVPVDRLVVPAAVLDVTAVCAADGHVVSRADVEAIEARDGPVPAGAAALVRTGWDAFLGDPGRYVGPAAPGLSAEAVELLVHERGVVGIGIDTLSIDAGASETYPAHRVGLPAGIWHLEGLVGLDALPARGAWVVVGVLPLVDGSGAPARVIALVP